MKKIFIYCVWMGFCLSLINTCSYAQEENYLEEGKEWSMQSGEAVGEVWYYTEVVFGEVEKYGHLWKRLLTNGQEFLLYRQEGKKIWACYPHNDGALDTVPFLMFDFGLKKGDTAHLYVDKIQHIDEAWIVDSVFDSIFVPRQGVRHCQNVYLMKNPDIKDVWVEGFGSLTNGLSYHPSHYLGSVFMLTCVQKETGDLLYHRYKKCIYPKHFAYDYSVQNWTILCKDTQNTYYTPWLYFKENGVSQWKRAYLSTKEDFSDEIFYGWYYQNMLQVYFKKTETDSAILLYDFGLEKGEHISGFDKVFWLVDSVYYMEMDGLQRRCLQVVSDKGETDVWVEGVGSLKTGLFPTGSFDNAVELLCVQADVFWHRGYMYHNTKYNFCHIKRTVKQDFHKVNHALVHYDAQQKNIVIENDFPINVLEIVDIYGRCVLRAKHPKQSISVAQLPHGMYVCRIFVNGNFYSEKFVR